MSTYVREFVRYVCVISIELIVRVYEKVLRNYSKGMGKLLVFKLNNTNIITQKVGPSLVKENRNLTHTVRLGSSS